MINCKTTVRLWSVAAAILAAGCASHVDRARPRHLKPDRAAVRVIAGELIATAPTPLLRVEVTIVNKSTRPLQVGYRNFTLVTADGRRLLPLVPFDVDDEDPLAPRSYQFPWYEFHLAPHASRFYRGFWSDGAQLPENPGYYKTYHQALIARVEPTADLLRRALPEGTLAPDGYITGILFFEPSAASRAVLRLDCVDAGSSDRFDALEIALELRGRPSAATSQ